MQPVLKPIDSKFEAARKKNLVEGTRAVEEMMKRPFTLAQAEANLDKLRKERTNLEQASNME
jgi:hypothetical protein